MSTPMRHAASQQGRTPSQLATPPVSTPFSNPAHAAFSPRGPRSSPQQVRKSPATSSMMATGLSSGGVPLNFDSPSTAAAMGAIEMGSSFGFGLNGVAVGGLDSLTSSFSGDDDKVKRLDVILKTLDKKGFVSEAGIARLAQRSGLELLAEDTTAPSGQKTRTLVIAGSSLALDIVLDNNIVQTISLSYHESPPSVARHADAASRILLEDLKLRPNQSPLTKTLDRFAVNLERMAVLDRLSISPGLDCQEALVGIYASLERLHCWDMTNLRQQPDMKDKPDIFIITSAMCTKHGLPLMHTRGHVGLTLQYWRELRLLASVDETVQKYADEHETIWSLHFSCAPLEAMETPPVRVSEDWISKEITKEEEGQDDTKSITLDWLEPGSTILPPSEENKDAGMEVLQPDLSTQRVPAVIFTVNFDPPVILPQNDWVKLYALGNMQTPNMVVQAEYGRPPVPPTYDSLFFPFPNGFKADPSESREISHIRRLKVYGHDGDESHDVTHNITLFIYKPIYAQEVTDMPFSHPKQLIAMLPLLRQYAFLSTLLRNSFVASKSKAAVASSKSSQITDSTLVATAEAKRNEMANMTLAEDLDSFSKAPQQSSTSLEDLLTDDGHAAIQLDAVLWVHPTPHIVVTFPFRKSTANFTIHVLQGGTVEIVKENILEQIKADGKVKGLTRQSLATALEQSEDLCKWAEWIRTRLS